MKLSKTMQECADRMRANGGLIWRYPGGYWGWGGNLSGSFGTSTVEALVSRGVAEYSRWQNGRSGRFPIEAKLLSTVRPHAP